MVKNIVARKKCPRCYAFLSCEDSGAELVGCDSCNRMFFENSCFERHRMIRSPENRKYLQIR